MILELTYARGMRLWIDGKPPTARGWSFGDYGDAGEVRLGVSKNLKIHEHGKDHLEIAGHKLTAIKSDVSFSETHEDHTPTKLTLEFADKPPIVLDVVDHAWGDPNEEEPSRRTLVNGETLEIDEITLYLRAEGG